MKFNKKDLLNAHNKVKSSVDSKSIINVFKTVRFIANDGIFRLIGQNSVYQIEATGECEGTDSFDLCLPSDKFGIMLSASQDIVSITSKDGAVSTQSGKSKFKFIALNGEDFPLLERLEDRRVSVNLREVIGSVHTCVNPQYMREYLRGVSLISNGDHIRASGSDGAIIATQKTELEIDDFDIIMPFEVANICAQSDSEFISINGRRSIEVVFSDGSILISRLIDGNFPKIDGILGFDTPQSLTIEAGEFKQSITIAQKLGRYVRLEKTGAIMQVSSQDSEMVADLDCEGDDLTISFDVSLLKKAIDISSVGKITFGFPDTKDRIKFHDGRLTIVVMPARL